MKKSGGRTTWKNLSGVASAQRDIRAAANRGAHRPPTFSIALAQVPIRPVPLGSLLKNRPRPRRRNLRQRSAARPASGALAQGLTARTRHDRCAPRHHERLRPSCCAPQRRGCAGTATKNRAGKGRSDGEKGETDGIAIPKACRAPAARTRTQAREGIVCTTALERL